MKQKATLFLRAAIVFMGMPVLLMCIFLLPQLAGEAERHPEFAYVLYPVLIGLYAAAIPFFIVLYQAFKLLGYIDKGKTFSELSVKTLKHIKICTGTVSALFVASMPFYYIIGERGDTPEVILIGMVLAFVPMVVAAFAALLQRLLKHAIAIKAENEWTI